MKVIDAAKGFLGYLWAIGVIFVTAMGFMNMDYFSKVLLYDNGVHVSENWTGGEVEKTIDHNSYKTEVHKPVIRGVDLLNKDGYVQIEWVSDGKLPDNIFEEFDYDNDGEKDFAINLDTKNNEVDLKKYNGRVISFSDEGLLVYEKSRVVRVLFKK